MDEVVYADTGVAPTANQCAFYPVASTFNVGTHRVVPSGVMCTNNTRPRLGACTNGSPAGMPDIQRVRSQVPVAGQFSTSVDEPAELTYVNYPYSTCSGVRKLAKHEGVHSLNVPEAGTQSRGNFKAEAYQPRATKSPAGVTSYSTFPSDKRQWQEEIEDLKTMLNTRETQLELKEADLQEALSKLQELRSQQSPALKTAGNSNDKTAAEEQEAELRALRKRVELLRRERQDLVELLLQKERQTAALDSVDPTAKEASALQLGIQAISMVQDASDLREKLQMAEAEIKTLRAEREAADELQQDTFDKLTDKRREAAELLELLSQRDMKVARVEAYLQQKSKELEIFATRAKERLQKEQRKREEVEQEYLVATEQCSAFKANIASRDEKILQLQAEVVRRDTLLKQLEERVRMLSDDLTAAHSQLQQMLRGMAAKDAYMQQLEAQLRKNDTERQVAYLTEVSKSRKLALDTRIQQEQCRAALNDKHEKLAAAKQDLFRSRKAMERVRKAVGCGEETEKCYTPSEALQSAALHSHPTDRLRIGPDAASGIPQIPLGQSLRSLGADFLEQQPRPDSECAVKPPQSASKQLQTPPKESPANSKAPQSTANLPETSSLATPLVGYEHLSEQSPIRYAGVRGDAVDQAVARVLERSEYRQLAAHICRLGSGAYLIGIDEVTLELEKDGNVLVRPPSGGSIGLTSYLDMLRSSVDTCPRPVGYGPVTTATAKVCSHSLAEKGELCREL